MGGNTNRLTGAKTCPVHGQRVGNCAKQQKTGLHVDENVKRLTGQKHDRCCCWPALPAIICEMFVQVPREALEFARTSINFRSDKFGYSICPIFSKVHAKFFREFWHDFVKNRTNGVSENSLII